MNRPLKNPRPTLNFGQIRRNTPAVTKKLLLSRGDGGPIAPELGPIRQPGIHAEIRTIQEGSHYELTATFSPPWPNGRVNTSFMIKTGVKQAPKERIRLVANVEARVTTAPQRLLIPLGGDRVERTARVRWSPGGDLSWAGLKEGRVYQLVTHMFVHGSLMHLLFNGLGIYFIGRMLLQFLSPKHFLMVYFGSGLLGGVLQLAFTNLVEGHDVNLVGASGCVYGLLCALATLIPNQVLTFLVFFVLPIRARMKTFASVFVIVSNTVTD